MNWAEVGKNIILGIVNGVKGAAVNLANSVKNAASDALGEVKSFLGIKSPSTVMRDQVGKMIGLGMAEGITDSTKQVNAALNGLNTQINAGVNVEHKVAGSGNVIVNVPLSMDGQVITKSTGRVQVKRNRTYSRSIGVMA
jgi:phage-related protein